MKQENVLKGVSSGKAGDDLTVDLINDALNFALINWLKYVTRAHSVRVQGLAECCHRINHEKKLYQGIKDVHYKNKKKRKKVAWFERKVSNFVSSLVNL